MKPRFLGAIVFLLAVAVAATPASGGEAYVAAAAMNGDATYMALSPDGGLSDPEDMQLQIPYLGIPKSFGNGLGDFNNDGELDYVMAIGNGVGDIFVFPKSGSGNRFDPAIWIAPLTEGVNPADIAVADFNGDGHLDFVLNFLFSPNCGLYLGNGDFTFEYTQLPNTTPVYAIGVDAADFNNDGLADFVVAPSPMGPFRVHLGNGDGTFEAVPIHGSPANGLAGIAAGDFVNDPDGNVDLAVSNAKSLEIYTGNGDGTFVLLDTYLLPVNSSSLDNGDFNHDGNQDLVVADYGDNPMGGAVLYGNGSGQFTYSATYTTGLTSPLRAVSALPYLDNKAPVAQLTPETLTVTVGETVDLDGSESYDEDGAIVSYKWDFDGGAVVPTGINTMTMSADGRGNDSGEPQSACVFFDSGLHYVTLTVTDDQGATATVQAEVQVEPLTVDVSFSPRRLNLKSKGKWISATIQLPRGYYASMIDTESLYLVPQGKAGIEARSVYGHHHFYKHYKKKYRKTRKLEVKFDRQALIEALDGVTGETSLTVMGDIAIDVASMGVGSTDVAKMEFSGTGIVKAYEKKKKGSSKQNLFQAIMNFFSKGRSK